MSHDFNKLLKAVLEADKNVRFAGISDLDGNLLHSMVHEGIETLMTLDETKDTLKHAAMAWKSRMKHYDKIGRGLYTLAVYEKLRRATIPLGDNLILLVTIDNQGGQKQIMDHLLNIVLYHDYTYPDY